MSDYGFQIRRDDGKLFASPDFTPSVLYAIENITVPGALTRKVVKTNIKYSSTALIFYYCTNSNKSAQFFTVNQDGMLAINCLNEDSMNLVLYIFDNKVRYSTDYGIFIYRSGSLIYTANCIPLVIKTATIPTNSNGPSGKFAVASGPAGDAVNVINEKDAIYVGYANTANQSGISSSVCVTYSVDPSSSASMGEGNYPVQYIDRALYDKYRKSAIGY